MKTNEQKILDVKRCRVILFEALQELRKLEPSREIALAITNLQQARFWLGEALNVLGAENPYPNGNNPNTAIVDPKSDTKIGE